MKSLNIHFISLFPETIEVWMKAGVLGQAHKRSLFSYRIHPLRNFANGKHASVDDVSYGGGGGMVLKIEPLVRAVEFIQHDQPKETFKVLCPSPAGQTITHKLVTETLRLSQNFIFVCGRYEGIDQRFIDNFVDLEFSLGDFVMSAGEIPAIAFADAIIRQIEGVLGNPMGSQIESFTITENENSPRLLEYPQYTRPANFRGLEVPSELLSGNHPAIQRWRIKKAKEKTLRVRPDMLTSA